MAGLEIEDTGPFICAACVNDPVLRSMLSVTGDRLCCSCNRTTDAAQLSVLAKLAGEKFLERFEEFDDTHYDYRHGLTFSQAMGKILSVESEGACELAAQHYREICSAADRDFLAPGMRYRRKQQKFDEPEHERIFAEQRWTGQARTFRHSRRYFNNEARKFFSMLFEVALQAKNRSLFEPQPAAIRTVQAGKTVVRARRLTGADNIKVKGEILADPKGQLGPPPPTIAKQNRMNPAGVPLFYGAESVQTAIAEVRPSIGDEVAIGRFRTTRALKFFDFTRFDQPLVRQVTSDWLDDYEGREQALLMLKYLHRLIAQPARSEESDYIMTQAMAEFLHHEIEGGFDGIIFGSVQDEGGRNYAIFEESDRQTVEFPLEPVGAPQFHRVEKVEFHGTWARQRPIADSENNES
ncbi:RES family NAD+ phosphorylase [Burkholderia gladioli]|uniref:RES family NAD+ phosphorylase n=1 Tax=Burkholderia gladioli TaxID=28095 RepID=UPI002FE107D4